MRVLRLDGSEESQRAYLHIHAAMTNPEVPCVGQEQVRRVGKILDKLEAIGVQKEGVEQNPQTGESVRVRRWHLADGGGELWLDDAQHQEVTARMNAQGWLSTHSRFTTRTFELLAAAPEEDPGAKKPDIAPMEQAS